MERMENDRIAYRVYVGECGDSCSVAMSRKRWIDTVKDLRKRSLDVRQARRMVVICEGKCVGRRPGDEPLTWTSCHSYMNPLRGGSLSVTDPTT